MEPERIIFFGRNQNFDITKICFKLLAEHLQKTPHRIVLTVVSDDNQNQKDSLDTIAKSYGIPWISIKNDDVNDPAFIKKLTLLNPTLSITVQFPKIFSTSLITAPSKGSLNIHKGWPYRGGSINERAIFNQLSKYYIILHHINEGIDTGNIIAKVGFSLSDTDDGYALIRKINKAGAQIFKNQFLPLLGKKIPKGIPQNKADTVYGKKGSLQNKITVQYSAQEIKRLYRAFHHPGKEAAYIEIDHDKVYIQPPFRILSSRKKSETGRIVEITAKEVLIQTRENVLVVQNVIFNSKEINFSKYLQRKKIKSGDLLLL